jgi:hypothetical protein
MGFWDDLHRVVSERNMWHSEPRSGSRSPGSADGLTLFRAVRSSLGVQSQDMDCADVAFWEWRDMRSLLLKVWSALDEVATRRSGRHEKASVWVHEPEQGQLDLKEFVEDARSISPSLPSLTVHRRPDAFLMVNIGKVDSAIGSTAAVVVAGSKLPYGEILNKLLKRGGTDEELLSVLDDEANRLCIDRRICDQSAIPREIVRAKQKIRDQLGLYSLSLVVFLEMLDMSNNLTNINDDALLSRLLQIAPEENKSIAKKIEAMRKAAN